MELSYTGGDVLRIMHCVTKIAEAKAAGEGEKADDWNWELACAAEREEDEALRSQIITLVDRESLARHEALIRVEHTTHGRRELEGLIANLRSAEVAQSGAAIDAAIRVIEDFAREDSARETACAVARAEAATFLRIRAASRLPATA